MTQPDQIRERMRQARLRARLSQEAAAGRLGITRRTYNRWELGQLTGFMRRIDNIAKALDTSPEELMHEEQGECPELRREIRRLWALYYALEEAVMASQT